MTYTSKLETITPKMAEKYINKNTTNRPLNDSVMKKYVADMLAGKWTQCMAPIVFMTDGRLADGQHRLWAIIESGTSQDFFVVHNATEADLLNIDTGATRSLADNMGFAGLDRPTAATTAAAKYIEWGTARFDRAPSYSELSAVVLKHMEAAKFAVHRIRGRGLNKAAVVAAVARAWYIEPDKEKLARFCEVYRSGLSMGEHEFAAITLREYCLNKARTGVSSLEEMRILFFCAQNAVQYFMRSKPLKVIRVTTDEAYPLGNKGKSARTTKR